MPEVLLPQEEIAKVPPPLRDAVVAGVLETKKQADWGRKKIIRWVIGLVGTGTLGIIWSAFVSANKITSTFNNTVATSKADHATIEDHTLQIQKVADGEKEISDRLDRLGVAIQSNQTDLLSAVRDSNNQTQHTFNRLFTEVGELRGARGKASATDN